MPRYVVGRLQDALNDRARPLRGSRLLLLGVAYKKDIDDVRESPSLELMHLLRSRGADVSYHDPHVRTFSVADEGLAQRPLASVPLTPASVAEYTAVLIATDHTAVDYEMVRENARLVVDTRGIYRDARQNVVRA
jgi:UDP-N-acetyl-D-glucosamine dehydrogenase